MTENICECLCKYQNSVCKCPELKDKYEKLLLFMKKEISLREYVCTTNHAVLLDNAKELLREIGELND